MRSRDYSNHAESALRFLPALFEQSGSAAFLASDSSKLSKKNVSFSSRIDRADREDRLPGFGGAAVGSLGAASGPSVRGAGGGDAPPRRAGARHDGGGCRGGHAGWQPTPPPPTEHEGTD